MYQIDLQIYEINFIMILIFLFNILIKMEYFIFFFCFKTKYLFLIINYNIKADIYNNIQLYLLVLKIKLNLTNGCN